MEIVAHSEGVSEPLEERRITLLNVVEAHGIAARIVAARDTDKGIEVVQAASGIVGGCKGQVAIRLLPHMEEAMHHVASVAVIGLYRTIGVHTLWESKAFRYFDRTRCLWRHNPPHLPAPYDLLPRKLETRQQFPRHVMAAL